MARFSGIVFADDTVELCCKFRVLRDLKARSVPDC